MQKKKQAEKTYHKIPQGPLVRMSSYKEYQLVHHTKNNWEGGGKLQREISIAVDI